MRCGSMAEGELSLLNLIILNHVIMDTCDRMYVK